MIPLDLRGRNTVSKKTPEIDSLYVYLTRNTAKFTHRHQLGIGYKYKNHKALIAAGEDEIHIYHRTVVIRGVTRGLTMISKNGKVREVQKFFNDKIKEIELNDDLFNIFTRSKTTPVELGIFYTYKV